MIQRFFILFLVISFFSGRSFVAQSCEFSDEMTFLEQQSEAMDVYDLNRDLVIARGGTATIFFSSSPKDIPFIGGGSVSKGSPIIVKLPLTMTEGKILQNEAAKLRDIASFDTKGLFVRAYLDRLGVLVMKYDKNNLKTLRDYIDPPERNPPPKLTGEQKKQVGDQLNEALMILRRAGIVHSDLKPENILVRVNEGQVKITILDLGIAAFEGQYPLGVEFGRGESTGYSSPEQVSNRPARYADDVFSVREILDELSSI